MTARHTATHAKLLPTYRALSGASAGSLVLGALLATSLVGSGAFEGPDTVAVGTAMLLVGFLLRFPILAVRKAMAANWTSAFKDTEWKTLAGEVAVARETDEYGDNLVLAFNGVPSSERYRIDSLVPVSRASSLLSEAVRSANPYNVLFDCFLMPGVFVFTLAGVIALRAAVAIGYVWLVVSGGFYLFCGALEKSDNDNAAVLHRLSKTKWRVLDGRIGMVRNAEYRGNDGNRSEFVTLGFADGSERSYRRNQMIPVSEALSNNA